MKRALSWLSLAFLLSGCLDGPAPSPLSLGALQRLKLAGVEVHSQGAVSSWPVKEQELLATANVDSATRAGLPTQDARRFPAAQAYFEEALRRRIGADMTKSVAPLMIGDRPVVAIVQVRELDVPSVIRRVFVDQQAKLKLQIDLVDRASGVPVLTYRTPEAQRWMIGGLGAVVEASVSNFDKGDYMIDEAVNDYRDWLRSPETRSAPATDALPLQSYREVSAAPPSSDAAPYTASAIGGLHRERLQ